MLRICIIIFLWPSLLTTMPYWQSGPFSCDTLIDMYQIELELKNVSTIYTNCIKFCFACNHTHDRHASDETDWRWILLQKWSCKVTFCAWNLCGTAVCFGVPSCPVCFGRHVNWLEMWTQSGFISFELLLHLHTKCTSQGL